MITLSELLFLFWMRPALGNETCQNCLNWLYYLIYNIIRLSILKECSLLLVSEKTQLIGNWRKNIPSIREFRIIYSLSEYNQEEHFCLSWSTLKSKSSRTKKLEMIKISFQWLPRWAEKENVKCHDSDLLLENRKLQKTQSSILSTRWKEENCGKSSERKR